MMRIKRRFQAALIVLTLQFHCISCFEPPRSLTTVRRSTSLNGHYPLAEFLYNAWNAFTFTGSPDLQRALGITTTRRQDDDNKGSNPDNQWLLTKRFQNTTLLDVEHVVDDWLNNNRLDLRLPKRETIAHLFSSSSEIVPQVPIHVIQGAFVSTSLLTLLSSHNLVFSTTMGLVASYVAILPNGQWMRFIGNVASLPWQDFPTVSLDEDQFQQALKRKRARQQEAKARKLLEHRLALELKKRQQLVLEHERQERHPVAVHKADDAVQARRSEIAYKKARQADDIQKTEEAFNAKRAQEALQMQEDQQAEQDLLKDIYFNQDADDESVLEDIVKDDEEEEEPEYDERAQTLLESRFDVIRTKAKEEMTARRLLEKRLELEAHKKQAKQQEEEEQQRKMQEAKTAVEEESIREKARAVDMGRLGEDREPDRTLEGKEEETTYSVSKMRKELQELEQELKQKMELAQRRREDSPTGVAREATEEREGTQRRREKGLPDAARLEASEPWQDNKDSLKQALKVKRARHQEAKARKLLEHRLALESNQRQRLLALKQQERHKVAVRKADDAVARARQQQKVMKKSDGIQKTEEASNARRKQEARQMEEDRRAERDLLKGVWFDRGTDDDDKREDIVVEEEEPGYDEKAETILESRFDAIRSQAKEEMTARRLLEKRLELEARDKYARQKGGERREAKTAAVKEESFREKAKEIDEGRLGKDGPEADTALRQKEETSNNLSKMRKELQEIEHELKQKRERAQDTREDWPTDVAREGGRDGSLESMEDETLDDEDAIFEERLREAEELIAEGVGLADPALRAEKFRLAEELMGTAATVGSLNESNRTDSVLSHYRPESDWNPHEDESTVREAMKDFVHQLDGEADSEHNEGDTASEYHVKILESEEGLDGLTRAAEAVGMFEVNPEAKQAMGAFMPVQSIRGNKNQSQALHLPIMAKGEAVKKAPPLTLKRANLQKGAFVESNKDTAVDNTSKLDSKLAAKKAAQLFIQLAMQQRARARILKSRSSGDAEDTDLKS